MKKIVLGITLLSLSLTLLGEEVSIIGQEVTGVNLQQLEYKKITNSNELLKNQKIESTNMEIVSDNLKRQRQRITVVQTDSIQLQEEVREGKKKKFLGIF
ncbi:MAG: hypothetical protein ACRCUA_07095 [Fusobacteriaceae bacterium]